MHMKSNQLLITVVRVYDDMEEDMENEDFE